ncbi:MAG TPA: O-antigen ligase family protein [Trueperaceae bacterium]
MNLGGRALGALAALYPPGAALLGSLPALRGVRPRLGESALLGVGIVLLAAPAGADVFTGDSGWASLVEVLDALVLAVCAIAGSLMARSGHTLRSLAPGVAVGLILSGVVSTGLWLVQGGRVSGWTSHPNIWGATVVLPLALVAAGTVSRPLAVGSFLAAYAVSITSGSRASLIGVSLVLAGGVLGTLLSGTAPAAERRRGGFLLAIAGGVALLVVLAVMQPRLWRSALEVLRVPPSLESGQRVLGPPQALGVAVEAADDGTLLVERTRGVTWARYQFPMILFPGEVYSTYWELKSETSSSAPGVLGVVSGDDTIELRVAGEGWGTAAGGRIELVAADVRRADDGWLSIALSFRSNADVPLRLWIGPAPDLGSAEPYAAVRIREAAGVVGGPERLVPGSRPPALSTETIGVLARFSAYRAAWRAFLARPLLGHRGTSFAAYYRANPPDQGTAVPAHAHNALLQSLFQRGLVGTAGLVLVLVWYARAMARGGLRGAAWLSLASAGVMNSVDTFLWSAWMLAFLVLTGALAGSGARPPGEV